MVRPEQKQRIFIDDIIVILPSKEYPTIDLKRGRTSE